MSISPVRFSGFMSGFFSKKPVEIFSEQQQDFAAAKVPAKFPTWQAVNGEQKQNIQPIVEVSKPGFLTRVLEYCHLKEKSVLTDSDYLAQHFNKLLNLSMKDSIQQATINPVHDILGLPAKSSLEEIDTAYKLLNARLKSQENVFREQLAHHKENQIDRAYQLLRDVPRYLSERQFKEREIVAIDKMVKKLQSELIKARAAFFSVEALSGLEDAYKFLANQLAPTIPKSESHQSLYSKLNKDHYTAPLSWLMQILATAYDTAVYQATSSVAVDLDNLVQQTKQEGAHKAVSNLNGRKPEYKYKSLWELIKRRIAVEYRYQASAPEYGTLNGAIAMFQYQNAQQKGGQA